MNRKWIWLAAWACVCVGVAAAANPELKLSTPLSATLKKPFCLHESPDIDSVTIICLNAGAPLTLVARLRDKEVVDGQEGHWYKAEVKGGASGWVFSTFLDILPEGKAAAGGCD
ncbi:MAG: hypothetical protein GTN49_10480 [candidate division Zixibacteria bacterium]|nr:hypothetical protein [candidate division Zixibacteria bacterium]